MDKIKNAASRTKKFVKDHKTALTVVATATPLVMLQLRTSREFNDFLAEKGLMDEYYSFNEEDEN